MIEVNSIKQEIEHDVSISNIEQILPTPIASPNIKQMQHANHDDEIIEPVSPVPAVVEARAKRILKRRAATKRVLDSSDDDFQPKRPRGRPPKTEPTKISATELKRLNPSDRRYYEMRVKNNEASRRSRLNRKGKEEALFDELAGLEKLNRELTKRDTELNKQLRNWEKRFLKLATI